LLRDSLYCVSVARYKTRVYHCSILFLLLFNDPATPQIYTLSLHDALPISRRRWSRSKRRPESGPRPSPRTTSRSPWPERRRSSQDRKSTRLNSSHGSISYAVFCLKKKKKKQKNIDTQHLYENTESQPDQLS